MFLTNKCPRPQLILLESVYSAIIRMTQVSSGMNWEGSRMWEEREQNRNRVKTVAYRPSSDAVSVCNPNWPGLTVQPRQRERTDRRCLKLLAILLPQAPQVCTTINII